MKKLLSLIIFIVIVISLVVVYKTLLKKETDEIIEEIPIEERIEIRFSWWGSEVRHKATLSVIELYESLNPNIDIIAEYGSYYGYEDKLMAQITGGNAPDIFTCVSEWMPRIEVAEGLYDMTGRIDVSGHSDKIIQASTINNKLGGVCISLNAKAILYNKTYLNELGLSVQESNYRIADMFESWEEVYIKSGGATYGIVDPRLTPSYLAIYGYTELQKKEPFPFTESGLSITAEDFSELMRAFDGLPEGALLPPSDSIIMDDMVDSPVAKRKAMFHIVNAGTFSIYQSQTEDELAMLPLPVGANGETGYEARPGLLLSVFSKTEVPEEAIAFLDFFTNSPEAAKILKTTRGVLPTKIQREALMNTEGLVTDIDKKIIITVDTAFAGETTLFVSGPVNAGEISERLYQEIAQEYIFGLLTSEEAGEKFIREANELIKEN